ncbi:MAG: GAF domain-containing protein [candidate division NC10 bacterium]|nr:GAF domain-containing protein [candidate division NC10 bacterium]
MGVVRRIGEWYGSWRLQARLTLQIVTLITALFGLLLTVVLMIQEAALHRTTQEKGFSLVRIFAFSSVQAVLAEDFLALRELVRSLVRQPEMRYAMILDLNGKALMHSRMESTGRIFHDPVTRRALAATQPMVQETRSGGEPVHDFTTPVLVLNERRAVARIGISFANEARLLRRTRNAILALGLLTLAGGLFWVRVHVRRLAAPIQALAEGAESLSRGDLGRRISVARQDEIGGLADAFNRMAESLQVRFQLDRELSSSLNLRTVLDTLVHHARRLIRGDLAFLVCCEEEGKPAAVLAHTGTVGKAVRSWTIRPGLGWTGRVLAEGRPWLLCPALSTDDPAETRVLAEEKVHALVLVPIRVRERCLGVLAVGRWQDGPFLPLAQEVLERLADQAAVALANAMAYREIEELTRSLEIKVAQRTAELSKANERLQELDRLKSEFVSNVSHELRTPLTAIRMSVENLADGVAGEIADPVRQYLSRIGSNTERLTRLISDLLDLSRIEAGRVHVLPETIPVASLLRDVLDSLRPVAAEKGLELSDASADRSLRAVAGRDQTFQVLTNLVGNAIKFTPVGGRVTVAARLAEEQGSGGAEENSPLPPGSSAPQQFIEIAVEDTGEGIPAEELHAIFDKFHQVRRHGRAKAQGTGLGLAISKSLIELMGGRIWVESRLGHGSRFAFTLPAAEALTPTVPQSLRSV